MRKLIMWNLISLDGYFEGEESWDLPWHLSAYNEELEQFSLEQLRSAAMLVFGRLTYTGMADHWQTAEGAVADYMNTLPKVVCSRTLQTADWSPTRIISQNVTETLSQLKESGEGDMFVFGSANLSESLMEASLFDEYRIGIAPHLHGRGRPLFSQAFSPQQLELLEARQHANGTLILRYRPRASR